MSHKIVCDRCGAEEVVSLLGDETEPEPPPGWFEVEFFQTKPPGWEDTGEQSRITLVHACPDCGLELQGLASEAFDALGDDDGDGDESGDGDGDESDDDDSSDESPDGVDGSSDGYPEQDEAPPSEQARGFRLQAQPQAARASHDRRSR